MARGNVKTAACRAAAAASGFVSGGVNGLALAVDARAAAATRPAQRQRSPDRTRGASFGGFIRRLNEDDAHVIREAGIKAE